MNGKGYPQQLGGVDWDSYRGIALAIRKLRHQNPFRDCAAHLLLESQILQFTIGRRRKDVWRTEKPAFQSPRFAIAILVPKRDQSYHGLLPASDNDLLAPASSLNPSRKIGLGLADGALEALGVDEKWRAKPSTISPI